MNVTVKFLVLFFLAYVLFKAYLFYRLNLALRRFEEKQKALKRAPAFDATRRPDDSSGPPRAIEL
ncbi:MAG TPA: hypothetical protein GXX28_00660 [Firmicutes bacterium]|nr:hypothetical protein [Bacillota bacterium]